MDFSAQTIGFVVFAVLLAGAFSLVLRVARTRGLLLPVAVGGGVRLAVMVGAHLISVSAGDHGFQYLDDRGYSIVGETLAAQWRSGQEPSLLQPLGILPHGGAAFYHLAGVLTLLTGNSVIPLKLTNVLFGTVTVLLSALLARRVIGPKAARTSAWVVALAPTIVWWIAPMLREPLTAMLLIGTLFTASHLPSRRALFVALVGLALLSVTRFAIFVAAGISVCAYLLVLAAASLRRERRVQPAIAPLGALLAVAIGVTGLGFTVLSPVRGAVPPTEAITTGIAQGRAQNRPVMPDGAGPSSTPGRGDVVPVLDEEAFASPLANRLAGGEATKYAAALGRFGVSPRAWAFADQPLDFYQPLYPGMWLWYAAFPVAVYGLWRLRHRPELLLVVGPIAIVGAIYAATLTSGVRQRSSVEPLLALLVVAGYTSRRSYLLCAAGALAVVAPVAALDLGSTEVGVGIAGVAGAIGVTALRAPIHRPPGPLQRAA